MNKKAWLPISAVAALFLSTTAFQVRENEQAIVMRFGAPVSTVQGSGLHFKLPAPIDTVVAVDMRLHMLDPQAGEYLTQDKKNLLVDSFMVWSVKDPLTFYKTVGTRGGAEARLTEILRSVVGDILSAYKFSDILSIDGGGSGLQRIATDLKASAGKRAERNMGIRIHSATIKRLNFPEQNKRAVFSRMSAERQAISNGYRSEGREEFDKIKAQTDLDEARLLAEAGRKAAEVRGNAEAEAAKIYGDAYGEDLELYKFLRSLRALEKSLGDDSLIVLPSDHVLLNVLQNSPSQSTPAKNE
jgi:membrane protease subunit HflC